jgi:predicted phosphodiesterase
MKIAVISDLHIGHCDETHQLKHSDHEFSNFLFYLESNYDKVILLGDIFEIEMELFHSEEKTYDLCKQNHNLITKRFNSNKYSYIYGNHDLIGKKFGGIESLIINYNNLNIKFIHGHQFDKLYTKFNRFLFLGGVLLKLNLKDAYNKISGIDLHNKDFINEAIDYAKNNSYDVIVTGHTHNPCVLYQDNVVFLNSGSCVENITYLHMDLDKKEYLIKGFED